MLKRTISILLALLLAASLCACGGKEKPSSTAPASSAVSSAVKSEPASSEPVSAAAEGEVVDLGRFKVTYPEGWYFNEDDVSKEDTWANIVFYDAEDKDEAENTVYMSATQEEAERYRKDVYAYADLRDFADGKLETQPVGGANFTYIEGDNFLIYRHEPTGVTYKLDFVGDKDAENVKALLEGVQLNLEDGDNVDAPWPWDGEPFQPMLTPQMVATFTVTPEAVPFEESKWVMDIMDHKFYKLGNRVFHLLDKTLDTYEYSESGLKFQSSMTLDTGCEYISSDGNGMLLLSPGIGEVIGVKDGQQVLKTTVKGDLVMHPSGEWGLTSWVNSDTQKVTNQGGVLTAEPWILTGLNKAEERKGPFSMISDIEITESHILVAGKMDQDGESREMIAVYDLDGNQLYELGGSTYSDPDGLGSITGMAETANGFVATDGNMRKIQFWNKEGTHLGAIETDDLFGTDYPWLEDLQLLEDGSLLVMLTEERPDESSDELLLFKLTGF